MMGIGSYSETLDKRKRFETFFAQCDQNGTGELEFEEFQA